MDISKVSARGVTDESLSSASDIVKAVTDGNDSASEEDSDDDDGED
jgi:HSF-type DNA-binding